MLDSAFSRWLEWPLWARVLSVVAALVAIDAARMAWPERQFLHGFFESYLAIVLYYAGAIAGISAGVWAGVGTAGRSGRQWLGWVVGIFVAIAVYGVFESVINEMPGVKWRIDAMRNSDCYTDWDGRTNPTVCD